MPTLSGFVLRFALALSLLTWFIWYFIDHFDASRIEMIVSREHSKLGAIQQIYRAELTGSTSSFSLVAEEIDNTLTANWASDSTQKTKLAGLLQRYSRLNPKLIHARLLDSKGAEVIRVNRSTSSPYLASESDLQDLSDVDYITATFEHAPGEVLVSRTTVAADGDTLGEGNALVVYLTYLLPAKEGRGRAIFAATYSINDLLQQFRTAAHNPPSSELLLITPAGYFLSGGERFQSLELGRTDGVPSKKLQDVHPDLWTALTEQKTGSIIDESGLFIFSMLDDVTQRDQYRTETEQGRSAGMIIFVPNDSLYATSIARSPQLMAFLLLLYATLIGAAVLHRRDKRTRISLINSQRRLELAASAGHIGLFEFNTATGNVICNQQFRDIHELPEESYPTVSISQLLRLVPDRKVDLRKKRLFEMIEPSTDEAEIVMPDGRRKWLQRTFNPTHNQAGQKVVVGTILDVTESRTKQNQLSIALERLGLAQDLAGIGVISADLTLDRWDGDEQARALFDLPLDEYPELTPTAFKQRYSSSEFQARDDFFAEALASGETMSVNREIKWRDGSKHYLQIAGKAFYSDAGDAEFLGVVYDLTSQIEQQLTLLDNNEKQRRMFGIISHELRTPAAAIHMLAGEMELKDDEREELNSVSRHLLSVIDDLRVAVNPDTEITLHIAPFDVHTLVNEVERQVSTLVSAAGMSLQVKRQAIDNGCDALVTDAYRLRTIVTNLIRNSVAHSGGSRIELVFETRADGETQAHLTIRVEDDGKGIPPDQLDRLFMPFERGDTAAAGTGVGLHLVKSWTEKLGGSVEYSTSELGGACFSVLLRLGCARHHEISAYSSESLATLFEAKAVLKGTRVLLVEDDRILRNITSRLLRKEFDIDLLVAEDGIEALKTLESNSVDVILTDYFMPNLDGVGLIQALRGQGKLMPIVALTAATIGEERSELMQAGAFAVLAKPLDLNRLAEVICQLAGQGELTVSQIIDSGHTTQD